MRPVLAITMGDPSGIGAEVTVKALAHPEVYRDCVPIVIGSSEALADADRFSGTGLVLRVGAVERCLVTKSGSFGGEDAICRVLHEAGK